MCGQNGRDGSNAKNHIGSKLGDSTIAPRFVHRRFKGDLAGKPVFLEFTVALSDKNLPPGYWVSTYMNYRDSVFGTSFLYLNTSHREEKYDNDRDKKTIRLTRNDESEQIGFKEIHRKNRSYIFWGYLDKKHGTYTGEVSHTRDPKVTEFPFEFKEDGLLSADYALLPRFEHTLKNANCHAINNYDMFQFTYYDTKILSGIFVFRDTVPESQRERGSRGCSNYAYSMNTERNQIIDIDRIFKPSFRDKLVPLLEGRNIELEKMQNGRFFVCKGGLVFVEIEGTQCYDEEYQGEQVFLPFSYIKDLDLIDEAYCKSMGIDLGY